MAKERNDPNVYKFEALIPRTMGDRVENCKKDYDLTNRQLLKAMIRVFLSAPDVVRRWSMSSHGEMLNLEEIRQAWVSVFGTPLPADPAQGPVEYGQTVVVDSKTGTDTGSVHPFPDPQIPADHTGT
jgi:hypothetical protein